MHLRDLIRTYQYRSILNFAGHTHVWLKENSNFAFSKLLDQCFKLRCSAPTLTYYMESTNSAHEMGEWVGGLNDVTPCIASCKYRRLPRTYWTLVFEYLPRHSPSRERLSVSRNLCKKALCISWRGCRKFRSHSKVLSAARLSTVDGAALNSRQVASYR